MIAPVLFAKKRENISCVCLKTKLRAWKSNSSFNNSRQKRMALSCSKKLSALLRGLVPKHDGDFYCLNCLYLFRTKNKLESHKKIRKDFCHDVMPSEDRVWWIS